MSKKRGLGRGLDALLGGPLPAGMVDAEGTEETKAASAAEANSEPAGGVRSLPVHLLEPNRFQPRTEFNEQGLEELADSIRAQGVIQPIVVTPRENGKHAIIAGERRWRAAQRAGLDAVPVVVREVEGDRELLELALVENLQRADLNPVEEAEAYRSLQESFQLSQEDIAKRVGKARTTVTNSLRLLRLQPEVLDLLRGGQVTPGQVRPLLTLTEARQVELAEQAAREGLSAREMERLASDPPQAPPKAPTIPDVHTSAAAERLTRQLQTRVEIRRRGKGGQVRIHFHSEDELMRLFDSLMERD